MQQQIDQVKEFHRGLDLPVLETATLLPTDTLLMQNIMQDLQRFCNRLHNLHRGDAMVDHVEDITVSLQDWVRSHIHGNIENAAESLTRHLYLVIRAAAATGLPLAELFEEYHRSRMSLMTGYSPPNIQVVLRNQALTQMVEQNQKRGEYEQ